MPAFRGVWRPRALAAAAVGLAVSMAPRPADANDYTVTVDASNKVSGLPHFWSNCVGTGTASLTLRSDLQTHYKLANRELGMQRVRGHGVLNDLKIYQSAGQYDWTNFDTYLKAIAAANMRPLMELSFLPAALGSNGTNSPPNDYTAYQRYIQDVVQRAVTDMGTSDVQQWYWEVWNEPNYSGFWSGSFADYLTLYSHAVAGATAVLPNILIGGPVTTSGSSMQIQQFLSYAKANNLRVAFASSHAYASGGSGNVADANFAVADNDTRVADIRASGLQNVVSVNSEWSSSYSGQGGGTADTVVSMDNHWNAPFIVKTVKLLSDQIQGDTPPLEIFSYWTVSDVFNEGYWIPDHNNIPFASVFGLMNFQGIRKATWNGFKMLDYLGSNRLTASGGTGTKDGVDAFAAESAAGDEVEIIVFDYYGTVALSSVSGTDTVTLDVKNLPFTGPAYVTQFPVDSGHANPYGVWVSQGKPVTPTEAQWEAMRASQHLVPTQMPTATNLNGSYTGTLTVPRLGAVLVTIGKSRPLIGRNALVPIEGEDYDGQSGITKEDSNDVSMGQAITGSGGSYVFFDDVDFSDAGVDSVQLRVNAPSSTTLELRVDSQTGTLVGTCPITATAGSYDTQTCALTHTAGVHQLFVNVGGTVHLNWFAFEGAGAGADAGTGFDRDSGTTTGGSSSQSTGSGASGGATGTASASSTGTVAGGSASNPAGGASTSSGASGGGGRASSSSGCGCSVVTGGGTWGGWSAMAITALGAAARRRRRASPRRARTGPRSRSRDGWTRGAALLTVATAGGCGTASPVRGGPDQGSTGHGSSSSSVTSQSGTTGAGEGSSSDPGTIIGGVDGDAGPVVGADAGDASTGGEGGPDSGPAGPTLPFMFTSAMGSYWQSGAVTAGGGTATLTVDESTVYQTITGFGGAFNERGWQYLSMLTDSVRTAALKFLFDANDGAHFQYGRIPIGSSDYAISRYTDDESSGDYSMAQFSIAEDTKYLVPYVKAALAIDPNIHLWGSAWTPPTWMKTGPYVTSSAFDGGNMKGDAQTLQAYALYLAKWVQAYAAQGVTVEMVVPQNEPSYAEGYPSCVWSPAVFDAFVGKYLGPLFASMNLSTQIFLGTMSKTSSPGDSDIMAAVLSDATAKAFIKGFGLQWTMQSGGALNFSNVSGVAAGVSSSHLPIWQTEHQAGNYPWASGFNASRAPNDYAYAQESWGLIRDWLHAGASSYSAWNMVLDTGGLGNDTTRAWPQDALLVVDTTAKTISASPAYYVFRHFSQYVQPGATRIGTTGSADALAFKNPDGSIVTVIHNGAGSPAQTVLSVGGTTLQFEVPANGFATIVQ